MLRRDYLKARVRATGRVHCWLFLGSAMLAIWIPSQSVRISPTVTCCRLPAFVVTLMVSPGVDPVPLLPQVLFSKQMNPDLSNVDGSGQG